LLLVRFYGDAGGATAARIVLLQFRRRACSRLMATNWSRFRLWGAAMDTARVINRIDHAIGDNLLQ